jgi:hypothetical protein
MEIEIELKDFLQGCNKKVLAEYYKIGPKGLLAWMQPHNEAIGKMIGGKYTPKQMIIILKKLGPPPAMEIPEDQIERLYQTVE